MLGHKMIERLNLRHHNVVGLSRDDFDATSAESVWDAVTNLEPNVVINCVGIIKQRAQDPKESIAINAALPHVLQDVCKFIGADLIHFSTDCVFSGKAGKYTEDDPSDAEDLYGRTKYLGEITAPNALTLRTSILGRETGNYKGLLEWFLRQHGEINGFVNAIFTGVTTNWLSDTVADLITFNRPLHGLYQIAAPPVTKYDLLRMLKWVYQTDVQIKPVYEPFCDRSLNGDRFRQATGIITPPLDELLVTQEFQDRGHYAL